jgi:hypothetical protein
MIINSKVIKIKSLKRRSKINKKVSRILQGIIKVSLKSNGRIKKENK